MNKLTSLYYMKRIFNSKTPVDVAKAWSMYFSYLADKAVYHNQMLADRISNENMARVSA